MKKILLCLCIISHVRYAHAALLGFDPAPTKLVAPKSKFACRQDCFNQYDTNKQLTFSGIAKLRGNALTSDLVAIAQYKSDMKYNLFLLKHCIKKCNEQE